MIAILAIDPGVTTGFCSGRLNDGNLVVTPNEAQFTLDLFDRWMNDWTNSRVNLLHVIYEDFEYRNAPRTGLNLTPVKLIGIIELYEERRPKLVLFHKQPASMGKAYFSDERLKELGVYVKGHPHARDATRHLLHWLQFRAGAQYCDFENLSIKLQR